MHRFLKSAAVFLQKSLAVLFAAAFVLTTVPALLSVNIETHVFDSEVYKQAMSEVGAYERLPGALAETLVGSAQVNAQETPVYLRNLAAADWQAMLDALFTPQEMEAMGNEILDQTFACLNGKANTASLSTARLKARLASPAGMQALLEWMQVQPACTPEQLVQLTTGELPAGAPLPVCSLPEAVLPLIQPNLEFALQVTAGAIPEQITFLELEDPDAVTREEQKLGIQSLRLLMGLLPIVPLGFLFLVTLTVVRTLFGWLRWWGVPFLIAGLSGVSMLWAGQPLFSLVFTSLIITLLPAYISPGMTDLIYDVTGWLLNSLLEPIALQALVLALAGLVMVIISFFVPDSPHRQSTVRPLQHG